MRRCRRETSRHSRLLGSSLKRAMCVPETSHSVRGFCTPWLSDVLISRMRGAHKCGAAARNPMAFSVLETESAWPLYPNATHNATPGRRAGLVMLRLPLLRRTDLFLKVFVAALVPQSSPPSLFFTATLVVQVYYVIYNPRLKVKGLHQL